MVASQSCACASYHTQMTPTGPVGGLRGSKGLVLLPTRELAMQCYQLLQDLCKFAPITSTLVRFPAVAATAAAADAFHHSCFCIWVPVFCVSFGSLLCSPVYLLSCDNVSAFLLWLIDYSLPLWFDCLIFVLQRVWSCVFSFRRWEV